MNITPSLTLKGSYDWLCNSYQIPQPLSDVSQQFTNVLPKRIVWQCEIDWGMTICSYWFSLNTIDIQCGNFLYRWPIWVVATSYHNNDDYLICNSFPSRPVPQVPTIIIIARWVKANWKAAIGILKLFLSFYSHPNISDVNFSLVLHFMFVQIFQIYLWRQSEHV